MTKTQKLRMEYYRIISELTRLERIPLADLTQEQQQTHKELLNEARKYEAMLED